MSRSSVSSVSSVTGGSPDKSPLELLRELRGGGEARARPVASRHEEEALGSRTPSREAISGPGPSDTTDRTDRTGRPASDSAIGAAKGSPAHRAELAWREGLARARAGFRRQGLDPMPGRVGACAALEAAVLEGRTLAAAPPARLRELLRRAYAGSVEAQLRCEGLAGRELVRALDAQGEAPAPTQGDTAEGLLRECRERGVRLSLEGDDLRVEVLSAPRRKDGARPGATACPRGLYERIVARQHELREALRAAGRA